MTSTKTDTSARKTAAKARSTAKAAAATTKQAERTAEQAQRTVSSFIRDTAFATVGATDNAMQLVKGLPAKAEQLRAEVAPQELADKLRALRTQLEQEFDALSVRGREVVRTVRTNPSTQRAIAQTRAARAQVKTAATSVRKAAATSADAADDAADTLGAERVS